MSSPRIAVLVATAPGFNPGMMVTELALAIFLRRHGWMGRTSVFRLRETSESSFASDAFETQHEDVFEYLSGREHYDSIVSSSLILLWADFLHMAQYLREREVILAENLKSDAGSTDAGIAVRKLFLLADADDSVLRRTISFGTTLLFNTIPDEADPSYGVPLRRLFEALVVYGFVTHYPPHASHTCEMIMRPDISASIARCCCVEKTSSPKEIRSNRPTLHFRKTCSCSSVAIQHCVMVSIMWLPNSHVTSKDRCAGYLGAIEGRFLASNRRPIVPRS